MASWELINRTKWQNVRKSFLSQFKHLICHYCYEHLAKEDVTVDHKVPISQGGEAYEYSNLLISCKDCNGMKGDYSLTHFDEWRKSVTFQKEKTRRKKKRETKLMSPYSLFFTDQVLDKIEVVSIKTPKLREEVIQLEIKTDRVILKVNEFVSKKRSDELIDILKSVKLYKPLRKAIKVNVSFKIDHYLFYFKAFKGRLKLLGRVEGSEMVMKIVDYRVKDF